MGYFLGLGLFLGSVLEFQQTASDWTIMNPIDLTLHGLLVQKQLTASDWLVVFDHPFDQPINLGDKDELLEDFLIWL